MTQMKIVTAFKIESKQLIRLITILKLKTRMVYLVINIISNNYRSTRSFLSYLTQVKRIGLS